MKSCKNLMIATIYLIGHMQASDSTSASIVALELASWLPKMSDDMVRQQKINTLTEKNHAQKIQRAYRDHKQQQKQKQTHADIVELLQNIVTLDENGAPIFLPSLEDKHRIMHLLNQLPSDSKLNLTDSADKQIPSLVSNLKKDLQIAINEQHKKHEEAAKKIQHQYRSHAQQKQLADIKEKVRNHLYLQQAGADFEIELYDETLREKLEKWLNDLPKNTKILLETRNGRHSKEYTAQEIYIDIVSKNVK